MASRRYTLGADDTLRVYVDGSEELSLQTTIQVQSGDVLSVGQEFDRGDASNFLAGRVDELRVYDRAFTIGEIGQFVTRP